MVESAVTCCRVIKETGAQAITLNSFYYQLRPGRIRLTEYHFDDCRVTVRDGLLPDGIYQLQGNFRHIFTQSYSLDDSDEYSFNAVSITGDNGLNYQVQGQTTYSSANGGFIRERNTTIANYQKTDTTGAVTQKLSDVDYNFNSAFSSAPFYYTETLDVDGSILSIDTGNQQVTLSTEPSMVRRRARLDTNIDEGQIEMLAEDGSFLYLSPNPFIDPDTTLFNAPLLIDLDYTTASGNQITSDRVIRTLQVEAMQCEEGRLSRIDSTGRYECIRPRTTDVPFHLQQGYNRPIIVP